MLACGIPESFVKYGMGREVGELVERTALLIKVDRRAVSSVKRSDGCTSWRQWSCEWRVINTRVIIGGLRLELASRLP